MITIYGIKNCDTMQKAFKWLDGKKIKYRFHNYKELGINEAIIETWLKHLPLDKVINAKSTTYRALTEEEKSGISDKSKAIVLMVNNTSLIKRPLWDLGNGQFFIGWDETALTNLLSFG